MNAEQKAIKAVANVAAQAYRRAFDVKPDMTTGALAVMADAIAALDQPTLAPKIDKEYAIWRAIGSLAQRVRDLEQPTAPEPPKTVTGVSNGKDTIWHDPKASQPLPAVEAAIEEEVTIAFGNGSYAMNLSTRIIKRLASLLPKAGQVPSVTELTFALWETGAFKQRATAQDCARHLANKFGSRMGQPSPLKGDHPSPVTAEKLVSILNSRGIFLCHIDRELLTDKEIESELPKAFPTLGQGRLTRDDPSVLAIVGTYLVTCGQPTLQTRDALERLIKDLLALQGPMTVSKEQWAKLANMLCEDDAKQVKAWLKDIGVEVSDD